MTLEEALKHNEILKSALVVAREWVAHDITAPSTGQPARELAAELVKNIDGAINWKPHS